MQGGWVDGEKASGYVLAANLKSIDLNPAAHALATLAGRLRERLLARLAGDPGHRPGHLRATLAARPCADRGGLVASLTMEPRAR